MSGEISFSGPAGIFLTSIRSGVSPYASTGTMIIQAQAAFTKPGSGGQAGWSGDSPLLIKYKQIGNSSSDHAEDVQSHNPKRFAYRVEPSLLEGVF